MRPQPSPFHPALRAVPFLLAAASFAATSSAQTATPPLIKVESHEVVLPIEVIRETKSTGIVEGSNGEAQLGWVFHSKEVTGLSTKSVHIFEDGMEQKIQHFSMEKDLRWVVRDNTGSHLDYSCTPKGFWVGPNVPNKISPLDDSRFHKYLVSYVPLSSPAGSCHRISIKVDRRHTKVFAPGQYCNTKDPLSDPLKQTELGNQLLAHLNSVENVDLPVSLQAVPFLGSSNAARVNLSAHLPASLLEHHWDGVRLITSVVVLGLILDRTGTLIARFSETACAPGDDWYTGPLPVPAWFKEGYEQAIIPSGYETQMDLNPGDYRLEFLLTDGEKFGRASTSFTVDDFSSAALSMSGIALCKRYHPCSSTRSLDVRGPGIYARWQYAVQERRAVADLCRDLRLRTSSTRCSKTLHENESVRRENQRAENWDRRAPCGLTDAPRSFRHSTCVGDGSSQASPRQLSLGSPSLRLRRKQNPVARHHLLRRITTQSLRLANQSNPL